MNAPVSVMAINGGSSSIRFALFEHREPQRLVLRGKVDRVGLSGTILTAVDADGKPLTGRDIDATDYSTVVGVLMDWLESQPAFALAADGATQ